MAVEGNGAKPKNSGCAVLPPNLPPRGLSREEAARYIGVGTTKFDELVQAKLMPGPKRLGSRVIWDRNQLDTAFEVAAR